VPTSLGKANVSELEFFVFPPVESVTIKFWLRPEVDS
jgi:hypothetical protein